MIFFTLSFFGLGCMPNIKQVQQTGVQNLPKTQTNTVASESGFGKLPKLNISQPVADGSLQTIASQENKSLAVSTSYQSGTATAMPGGMTGSSPGIMMPSPPINRLPSTVEYQIDAQLPAWQTQDDVLKIEKKLPDATTASSFARLSSLPGKAMANNSTLISLNFQWRDANTLIWSFEAASRQLSFWQEASYYQPMPLIYIDTDATQKINYDKNEILSVADAFLDAHGFTSLKMLGGKIQQENGDESTMSSDYRCSMTETNTPHGTSSIDYPQERCYMQPQTLTAVYGGMQEGRPVIDFSGHLSNNAYINVNIQDKKITSGNIQLDQDTIRSAYPMIDYETAKMRLSAGGLNPVYAWGTENVNIKVNITSISLAWLKYDSWSNNENTTYLIPALLAIGTVQRGKDAQTEKYSTTLPLVDDDAFEEIYSESEPVPLPAVNVSPSIPIPELEINKIQ